MWRISVCEACGTVVGTVRVLEQSPPFRSLRLCKDCFKAGKKVAYGTWLRLDTLPLWKQIAETTAADKETLAFMKKWDRHYNKSLKGDDKADRKYMDEGHDVHSILESMSIEFEEHFESEDFAHYVEDQIREEMDNAFFDAVERHLKEIQTNKLQWWLS